MDWLHVLQLKSRTKSREGKSHHPCSKQTEGRLDGEDTVKVLLSFSAGPWRVGCGGQTVGSACRRTDHAERKEEWNRVGSEHPNRRSSHRQRSESKKPWNICLRMNGNHKQMECCCFSVCFTGRCFKTDSEEPGSASVGGAKKPPKRETVEKPRLAPQCKGFWECSGLGLAPQRDPKRQGDVERPGRGEARRRAGSGRCRIATATKHKKNTRNSKGGSKCVCVW